MRSSIALLVATLVFPVVLQAQKPRERDLKLPIGGMPGALDAITDVAGVEVGHTTLISGSGKLVVGNGPVRTGVTVIHPRGKANADPVFAAWFTLNGNGEMTGTTWVQESGLLEGPVAITNTHSVGVVRDTIIGWEVSQKNALQPWWLPVVAETYDGGLNDINGFHVKPEHVVAALDGASGGVPKEGLKEENVEAVEKGFANLKRHVENVRKFGVPVVVAVNRFTYDTPAEIDLVKKIAVEAGAEGAFLSEVWAKGGDGGRELAEAVVSAAGKKSEFRFLYELNLPIKQKIETIAKEIYGADGVTYLPEADRKIRLYTRMGYANLPICMAKTHLSLSHDQNLKGRPRGFVVPIRDVRLSAGAGFLYPLLGEMRTMPGLPSEPAGEKVDLDDQGRVVGLF